MKSLKSIFPAPLIILLAVAITLNGCSLKKEQPVEPEEVVEEAQEVIKSKPRNKDGTRTPEFILSDALVLDLVNTGLEEFPKEALELTDVTKLMLSNNKITSIPAEIGELTKLEELYLDNNQLEGSLPDEIQNLENLLILNLRNNNLSEQTLNEIKAMLPDTNVIF